MGERCIIMRPQDWNDLLRLLGMMVMSSGKPPPEEIETFQKTSLALRDAVCPELRFTKEMAHDWLDHRRTDITKSISSVYFDAALKKVLGNLQRLPRKRDVLLSMIKMTIDSDEQTRAEHRIISRATQIWSDEPDPGYSAHA